MKKCVFKGVATAIVTPLNQDGSINYDCFKKLIDFQIDSGVDAIVVCGTTGEASTLTHKEHLHVVEFCCRYVNGRVCVIAGSGSNDTTHAVEQSKKCCECGADALLVVTPYYNKTTQAGLVKHYNVIADAADKPIIVYNVPSRTGLNILPETYLKLSEHENIVGTKEANGNIAAVAKTAKLCKENLAIYSGNDDMILPILALGGLGAVSVLSNIAPQAVKTICESFFNGETNKSRDAQLEYIDLINALFCEVNPMPVKFALNLMGYDVGPCRMPLTDLHPESIKLLAGELERRGLLSVNLK